MKTHEKACNINYMYCTVVSYALCCIVLLSVMYFCSQTVSAVDTELSTVTGIDKAYTVIFFLHGM